MRFVLSLLLIAELFAAPAQDKDFGTKFFEDLRKLFGRLQQSELDLAFRRANAIRCSELVSKTGEWKPVAFLNDDRKLADWHHDNIDDVKRDATKYVFSGVCRGEQGPVKVATSFSIQETQARSKITLRDNPAISVIFDSATNAYIFTLPYLYLQSKDNISSLYTENPPLLSSKPDPNVAEEFRCKSVSDAELTYRFLICRTRVANSDERVSTRDRKQTSRQPLGNSAYQILSDGKEASSNVKLTFGDDVESKSQPVNTPPTDRRAPVSVTETTEVWVLSSANAKLIDVGQDEFRLRFNAEAWNGRLASPQVLIDRAIAPLSSARAPAKEKEYCVWQPLSSERLNPEAGVYSLGFKNNVASVPSVTFSIDTLNGSQAAVLECYFPNVRTPADITVQQWQSIVGKSLEIERRRM